MQDYVISIFIHGIIIGIPVVRGGVLFENFKFITMAIRLTPNQNKVIKILYDNEGSYVLEGKLYAFFQEIFFKDDKKYLPFQKTTLTALVNKGLLEHYHKPDTWTLSMLGTQEASKIKKV